MTMTLLLTRYASTLSMRYDAKDAGNFDMEDAFLDQLDELWLQMSGEERRACDHVAQMTKQRHRMQRNFVSTSVCWRVGGVGMDALGSTVSFAVFETFGTKVRQSHAPVRNPSKNSSKTTIPFEPMAAFG